MRTLIQILVISIFSVVVHYTVYYRFTPNYLTGLFSEDSFKSSYNKSVFKYRFVGIKLHLYIYNKLKKSKIQFTENPLYSKRLTALDKNADPRFYASYFILNTLSCTVAAILLLLIYNFRNIYKSDENEKIITIVAIIMFIGLTQFVLTPYDNLSYACFSLSFYLFIIHQQKRNVFTYILLSISILFATLVRESSLLILCTITSIYLVKTGNNIILTAKKVWLPCFAFLIAYVGVRYYMSGVDIVQTVTFQQNFLNFAISKILAILFIFCLFYFLWIYTKGRNRILIITFMLLTIPYLVLILVAGLIIELRLWVPFILGIILLNKLDLENLSNQNIAIKE